MKLLRKIWNFIDIWNYLKYMLTLNEKYLFEDYPRPTPDNCGFVIACKELVPRVKAIPFAETGCIDEHGHEHELTKVYTCENCHHELEIPNVVQRPLGDIVNPCTSDAITYGKPTIYNSNWRTK